MKPIRVAVVQHAPVAFNVDLTLQRVQDLLTRAMATNPDLVLFPEAFVPGFPSGLDWGGAATGVRGQAGQNAYLRYHDSAIVVPGPITDRLAAMARTAGAHLVVGVIERAGSTLGCSVLHFGRDGTLLGVRRKVMPTMAERTIWGQTDGASLTVAATDIGQIGTVICWENYMPLLRYAMYAQGVQIYCAPTADDLETWTASMQHIAIEGRCFVLSAAQFTQRCDFPAEYGDFPSDDAAFIVSRGGSCIIDPFGTILAGPVFNEPVILTADLDLNQITRGKFSFDVVGHYARPDIFSLRVDRRSRPAVTYQAD